MDKDEVIALLKAHEAELRELRVAALYIFGSVARGEAGPDSDVDLLVDFSRPIGLFHFLEVKERLEDMLGCDVDLVTRGGLRPEHADQVLDEALRAA